ncbi:MAG: 3-hydroxyacyl-CoA dehydrogenase, partial [Gammaproteobacteria bacterium]
MSKMLDRIAIAGAGRMGRGIALAFAWAGRPVTLVDSEARSAADFAALAAEVDAGLADEARQLAAAGLLTELELPALLDRIELAARADAAEPLAAADVVFEAVLEVLDVKRDTYAWLSEACSETAIFASTTSTMLADTLAGFVSHPERYINAHWLNPAYLMPLVEISPCAQAQPANVESLRALLESAGKVPVVCKASPGYIVSRVQALLLNEAARMVAEGVATPEDIDRAIRCGFGPRYSVFGALEFIDWGGGDILY